MREKGGGMDSRLVEAEALLAGRRAVAEVTAQARSEVLQRRRERKLAQRSSFSFPVKHPWRRYPRKA